MGWFGVIRQAAEKLFGAPGAERAAGSGAPEQAALNRTAGEAIKTYIEKQNLGLSGLSVDFDGASGTVTLAGAAPSRQAAEQAALAAASVASVAAVDNRLNVPAGLHDMAPGERRAGDTASQGADPDQAAAGRQSRISIL